MSIPRSTASSRRLARDDQRPINADDCVTIIKGMLRALPPEEGDRLLEAMKDMVDSGDPEIAGAEQDFRSPYAERSSTGGTPTLSGEPTAADRRHAAMAADERLSTLQRSRRGFLSRFPVVKRIRLV